MRKYLVSIIGLVNIVNVYAQSTIVGNTLQADTLNKKETVAKFKMKNALYIEACGNALFGSINYEITVKKTRKYSLAIRAGFGIEPKSKDSFYPIEVNYYRGKQHNLEIGVGFTPSVASWKLAGFGGVLEKNFQGITTFRLGYRYHNNDIILRVGAMLLWRSVFINDNQERYFFYEKRNYYSTATIWDGIGESITPWFGISFGYYIHKKDVTKK